ncbi:MAG TPA: hypothetical protein ENN88_00685, partial [Candidatus Coatesbacteria bacterium]|nr:hypothetical protein [Candidatus Coatesbacteria bacterium]
MPKNFERDGNMSRPVPFGVRLGLFLIALAAVLATALGAGEPGPLIGEPAAPVGGELGRTVGPLALP